MADVKIGGDVKLALGIAGFLVLVGVIAADATVTILLVPTVYLVLVYVMARVPLRYSMMALMFCAFTLENPAEGYACGCFRSPLFGVGCIVLDHLNTIDRTIGATSVLSFSGMDLCLVALLVISTYRKATGSKIDTAGNVPTPRPLVRLAFVSLIGTAYVWTSGMLRGGNFGMSLWQLDRVMYLPITFLLFHRGLRGPKDLRALARVVLTAATIRALLAVYIIKTVSWPTPDPETGSTRLSYATSHHDSMLFACAFVMLIALVMERAGARARRLALLLLPVLIAGMIANGRRMAWVQIALVFTAVYMVSPDNPVKRKLRIAAFGAAPVIAGYLAVGWSSGSSIFKPVQMIRSVVDSKSDASTMWRELENFDLISTFRMNPIFGTGYGNAYVEVVRLPAIDYALERYIPHNSILGLWCYCGYFGYTAMTLLWAAGAYFAMRAYHATKEPELRAAAQVCFGAVLIYMVQCWGDLGLGTWAGVFLVAPSLATAGKLAVATGEWGKKKKAKKVATKSRDEARGPVGMPGVRQTA